MNRGGLRVNRKIGRQSVRTGDQRRSPGVPGFEVGKVFAEWVVEGRVQGERRRERGRKGGVEVRIEELQFTAMGMRV